MGSCRCGTGLAKTSGRPYFRTRVLPWRTRVFANGRPYRSYTNSDGRCHVVAAMTVIVLTTTVTRQSPHTARSARHIKNKRTTCAEDTQNPHYPQVLTVADRFPKFLFVLRFTGMAGVCKPCCSRSLLHIETSAPHTTNTHFTADIHHNLRHQIHSCLGRTAS